MDCGNSIPDIKHDICTDILQDHSYILRRLQRHDNKLFKFNSRKDKFKISTQNYSRMCSASTQPIVLNYNPDNDPTIDRRSYTYALKYKSDPNMKDRYYICPRAFDPIVEKPVFFDSIKDIEWKNIQKTGKKMIGTSPYGNQTLINSSPDYLKLISQLPHGLYPGFKNPNNNPDNLCMPCCFIKSKLNNIRTKKCLGIDSNDIIVDDNKNIY